MKTQDHKGYLISSATEINKDGRWTASASFNLDKFEHLTLEGYPAEEFESEEAAAYAAIKRVVELIDRLLPRS
jgi:hypothetical protein